MIRRLGSDLAVAAVAAGGAAAITFPYGFGWGEFLFVGCLMALLLVGLVQAGRTCAAASAQRRRARALAVTSPSEAAVRAADQESARMAGDIRDAAHRVRRDRRGGLASAERRAPGTHRT